jgi:hypothetical protein
MFKNIVIAILLISFLSAFSKPVLSFISKNIYKENVRSEFSENLAGCDLSDKSCKELEDKEFLFINFPQMMVFSISHLPQYQYISFVKNAFLKIPTPPPSYLS